MRLFPAFAAVLILGLAFPAALRAEDVAPEAGAASAIAEAPPSIDEYNSVPEGLLAPPPSDVKVATSATPVKASLPQSLGQMPDVYEIPGATQQRQDDESALAFDQVLSAYNQGKYDLVVRNAVPMAEAKQHDAEQLVGVMYLNGQGMAKDMKKAFDYLTRAAEANKPLAQHYLAVMYFAGQGTEEPDSVRALMWVTIAILHYPDGPEKDRAKTDRDAIYTKMTRVEKNRALSMARDWLDKQGEGHLMDMAE